MIFEFVVFTIFTAIQLGFLGGNISWLTLMKNNGNGISFESLEDSYPVLTIYIPICKEPKVVVQQTIERLYQSTYPNEKLEVFFIYEEDDELVQSYITDLCEKNYISNISMTPVEIRNNDIIWDEIYEAQSIDEMKELPRNKARALTYAFFKTNPEGYITVLDSDTGFKPNFLEYGVGALENSPEIEIVQSKQTVRNFREGTLPYLESAGISAWTNIIYENTITYPYQLLGKGYFIDADHIREVNGWDVFSNTEDMSLGVDLYQEGIKLGVLDTYVTDLCPETFSEWVKQKRRWMKGPYNYLDTTNWDTYREQIKFFSYTFIPQTIAILTAIGIPFGVYVLYISIFEQGALLSFPIVAITTFNAFCWGLYSVFLYKSALEANRFNSKLEKIKYVLYNNPISQLYYTLFWVFPIIYSIYDTITQNKRKFSVTKKKPPETKLTESD